MIFLIISGLSVISCSKKNIVLNPGYRIVVDFKPFSSVAEAGVSEKSIDWNDTGIIRQNSCTDSYAALELQKYLRKLSSLSANSGESFGFDESGKDIPGHSIVLTSLSGTLKDKNVEGIVKSFRLKENLTQEGSFSIIPDKGRIFIIGHDRTGTLYGVYQLLEMLGAKWYAPGDSGEYIPETKSLVIPDRAIIQNPSYYVRGFWAWEPRGNSEFFVWMARNRLNLWTLAEKDHSLLNKLGIQLIDGGHIVWNDFLSSSTEYPYNHSLFHGDEDKPSDPYKVSTDYRGDENHDGKLSYYEAHPEWYGLSGNKREKITSEFGTNICTSNKDGVNEFCHNLITALTTGKWKDACLINIWPLDGGQWCQCDACRLLGTPTDRLIVLINQIDKAIKEAKAKGLIHRNIRVLFPVYFETQVPPSRPLPADFDYSTCIGTYFPIYRCYEHYFDDSTCTEHNTALWKDFESWTKDSARYYRGQLFMGEYYNVSRINNLPFIARRMMEHDIPLYYDNGVRYFHYMHVCIGDLGMKRVNNYLMAKLLWDVKVNADSVYNDYLKACYGPVAEPMGRLYSKLEFAMSNIKQLKHVPESLQELINKDADTLFPLVHFQIKPGAHGKLNSGVSLEESLDALKGCRNILDSLKQKEWSGDLAIRLKEDDDNLRYAENTYNLYYYFTLSLIEKRAGNRDAAKKYYEMTIPYAKSLKAETRIVITSSVDGSAKDGLDATRIEDKYLGLGKSLGMGGND